MAKRYVNISMPKELANRINTFITEHRNLGYTSISEFTKDAVRRFLSDLEPKGK